MMKKYWYLTLFVVSCSFFANAQTSAKDSLMTVIAKEVCVEIGNRDFSGKTPEEMNLELGLAIMPSISSRLDVLKKYYGADMSQEGLNQVGEEVGMKLAVVCPDFIKLFANNKEFLKSSANANKAKETASGTLQKIVPGDFTYFLVKDPNGKLIKIWWMEQFDGAEKLTDQLINKPVVITYTILQTYNAQMQEYIGIKVATKLQVIQ